VTSGIQRYIAHQKGRVDALLDVSDGRKGHRNH
jgi:hypothetical protein